MARLDTKPRHGEDVEARKMRTWRELKASRPNTPIKDLKQTWLQTHGDDGFGFPWVEDAMRSPAKMPLKADGGIRMIVQHSDEK